MTHEQVPFDEFMRRAAQLPVVKDTPETRAAIQKARDELNDTSCLEAFQGACDAVPIVWEDESHGSYDIDELDKEFRKRLYKDTAGGDPATQLIREALNYLSHSRCEVCKGPATREALKHVPSFCDEHGLHDLIRLSSEIQYRDLRNANWIRKAVALLKERDGI